MNTKSPMNVGQLGTDIITEPTSVQLSGVNTSDGEIASVGALTDRGDTDRTEGATVTIVPGSGGVSKLTLYVTFSPSVSRRYVGSIDTPESGRPQLGSAQSWQ